MYLRMHICAYQEAPSGMVVFMRPCFCDCSCVAAMNIQCALRGRLPWNPGGKKGKDKMWLVTHIHSSTCVHTYTRVHTALQQWEERATVTNNSGATKVAGNLSNGTIKLQLSFFSFFYSRCMYLGG